MLKGKHILLGITGSIAAYKSALIVRNLIRQGAEVKVIMTDKAKEFITPLTMATLSKNPVLIDSFDPTNGNWNSHIDLGIWADLFLIAPATANTIAKMSAGIADNLLLTSYLSSRCPVVVAPAMDMDMFAHPATRENFKTLVLRGVQIIEPASGELASGLDGKGRMEEPEAIVNAIADMFKKKEEFKGKTILITAGPTRESIDPVRFISNNSSGKMGFALALEFAERGGNVLLVSGPVTAKVSHPGIKIFPVITASEMYKKTTELYKGDIDVTILAAAVSDFTPETASENKIKKGESEMILKLRPTVDIASALGNSAERKGFIAGFALETDNESANALSKLERKNLDIIVLNSLRDEGAGFSSDTNKITIFDKTGDRKEFALKSKSEVASDIVSYISERII